MSVCMKMNGMSDWMDACIVIEWPSVLVAGQLDEAIRDKKCQMNEQVNAWMNENMNEWMTERYNEMT